MPRRSRGCATCRARRIRCDEGLPACQKCLETGRHCPGPIQGLIVVDQTKAVSARRAKKKPLAGPVTQNRGQLVCVTKQPTALPAYSINFIDDFMSFIMARVRHSAASSWLMEVWQGFASGKNAQPALDLAVQAASLAYCATKTRHITLMRLACETYGTALTKHSTGLSSHKNGSPPDLATMCTCVLMAFFESMSSATISAYGAHLCAAQRLLLAADDETQQMPFYGQLVGHIQSQMLLVMVTAPEDYLKTVPPGLALWRVEAVIVEKPLLSIFNALVRALLELTDWIANLLCGQRTLDDKGKLSRLQDEVAELHKQFQYQCTKGKDLPGWQYQDPWITMVTSYFAAADIVLSLLDGSHEKDELLLSLVEGACGIVLYCCHVIEEFKVGCGYLRMFFPLALVALYSPKQEQRHTAQHRFLVQWLQKTVFTGLCYLVLQRLRDVESTRATNAIGDRPESGKSKSSSDSVHQDSAPTLWVLG